LPRIRSLSNTVAIHSSDLQWPVKAALALHDVSDS